MANRVFQELTGHSWPHKALAGTDAMSQVEEYHTNSSGSTRRLLLASDQPVHSAWAGDGDQVSVYVDGEEWQLGCVDSHKYKAVLKQLHEYEKENALQEGTATVVMLTDKHWSNIAGEFTALMGVLFGMNVVELHKYLRQLRFQEDGHENETPIAFLCRYETRTKVVVALVLKRQHYAAVLQLDEHSAANGIIAIQEPKTVVHHLATLYGVGNSKMAEVIKFIQVEANRTSTVTWEFIKRKGSIAWNNGLMYQNRQPCTVKLIANCML